MRFSVRVPVLSTQRTVAEPSASMAAMRRVRTRRCEMRQAPSARKIVRMTGNSSGISAIASARPASRPSQPVPARDAVEDDDHEAHRREAGGREQAHPAARLASGAASRRSRPSAGPCRSCPSSVPAPVAVTRGDALPSDDERPRADERQVVAAGPARLLGVRPDALAHGHRLARQQRLVHREAHRPEERRASAGTRSPFGEDDEVAAHDLAARDPLLLASAHDEGAGAGQVPQRVQRPLRLPALVERDADHHEDRRERGRAPPRGRPGAGTPRRSPRAEGSSAPSGPRPRGRTGPAPRADGSSFGPSEARRAAASSSVRPGKRRTSSSVSTIRLHPSYRPW